MSIDDKKKSNADSDRENLAAGDDAMEDDLTEERQITPQERADVAADLNMDP